MTAVVRNVCNGLTQIYKSRSALLQCFGVYANSVTSLIDPKSRMRAHLLKILTCEFQESLTIS